MIVRRSTLRLGLAILLVWAGLGGVAAAGCGGDDPFGGGQGCQDLQSNDPPGGSSGCDGSLVVTGMSSGAMTLDVGLANPTTAPESGYIIVTVVLYDKMLTFAAPVSVASSSSLTVKISFPGAITPIGVVACAYKPGGIVDTPDPITVKTEAPEEEGMD